jgi:dihydroxyacetone kinase
MNSVLGPAELEVAREVLTDVSAASAELNRLDGLAGDGDLGITVTAGTSALLALLPELEGTTTSEALRKAGMTLARAAPSSCGTLLARALLAAADEASGSVEGMSVDRYLEAGAREIQRRGGANAGGKTMLDALLPAIDRLKEPLSIPFSEQLDRAAEAAEAGAEATRWMEPSVGRSAWLAERSRGQADAGAYLIALVLRAWAARLTRARAPSA